VPSTGDGAAETKRRERRGTMNHTRNLRIAAGLGALALALVFEVSLSAAQSAEPAGGASNGQPSRAIRLSYVDGQVRLSQGGQVLADQAVVNTPLFEGMQLATGDSGKAEIQFEDGSVVRIPPDSSLTLTVLKGSGTSADAELTLNNGLSYFELQGGYQNGKIGVHFGDSEVTTSGFTVLRVDMDRLPGQVAVFSGNAHLESGNGSVELDLHDGESVALNGADPSHYDMAESIEPDSWDEWNSDRDQALTSEAAAQTGASSEMGQSANPAWNDLDANGSWYNVPGQGYVWSPYVAANAGFDPYGYGSWMWTPGFGYIWSSGYQWGYLPYQCGAWNFYDSFGWAWAPGFGGCMPWWGLGFYGGPNFGYVPQGYRPIARPILPRRPITGQPIPLVSVNRRMPATSGNGLLPLRNAGGPVTIAGSRVQALRPLPSRAEYAHLPPGTIGGPRAGSMAAPAKGEVSGTRPGYIRPEGAANAGASHGAGFGGTPARGSASGGSHPSGGSATHASSGASSSASHAGGGGFSGGGGGGGGGGSHGGGGGGGGGGGHH